MEEKQTRFVQSSDTVIKKVVTNPVTGEYKIVSCFYVRYMERQELSSSLLQN